MIIQRAYKTELKPTLEQRDMLYKTSRAIRAIYNWGVATNQKRREEGLLGLRHKPNTSKGLPGLAQVFRQEVRTPLSMPGFWK